ncbi:hypothetical protein EDB87DRAFT_1049221 [Lactarius vividus]|nr:hypothetical protein EDB87DRAFT_1049221 [Lactarius vividus]
MKYSKVLRAVRRSICILVPVSGFRSTINPSQTPEGSCRIQIQRFRNSNIFSLYCGSGVPISDLSAVQRNTYFPYLSANRRRINTAPINSTMAPLSLSLFFFFLAPSPPVRPKLSSIPGAWVESEGRELCVLRPLSPESLYEGAKRGNYPTKTLFSKHAYLCARTYNPIPSHRAAGCARTDTICLKIILCDVRVYEGSQRQ